jgi:hypothetical protein
LDRNGPSAFSGLSARAEPATAEKAWQIRVARHSHAVITEVTTCVEVRRDVLLRLYEQIGTELVELGASETRSSTISPPSFEARERID